MEAKRQKRITTKVGTVVAKKSAKTLRVLVERLERHPVYRKTIKRKKIFLVHDEHDKCQVGDVVRIVETRPISKLKRWRVAEIVGLASKEIETETENEGGLT
ncbi:MAG: 30S ribosomal protein S17 [Candidatus Saccharicenans sp.]|jgi:small subunit ribosomal protein S17|nr:30S ribosomal protein S17 [Candidatus Saccharicenans sp.]MDH7494115.1 30S ribosomal protein S17 [Candidatus Saccharicenans sp.]